MVWAQQQLHGFDVQLPPIKSYPSVEVLAREVAQSLAQVKQLTGKSPKVMVMGAKGMRLSLTFFFADVTTHQELADVAQQCGHTDQVGAAAERCISLRRRAWRA